MGGWGDGGDCVSQIPVSSTPDLSASTQGESCIIRRSYLPAAHSRNSDEQGWETLTAYTCNYARPARKAHNMVCSTLQALHGLRHPSFLEEGAGKRCSECGSAIVRVPCTRKHGHKHWPQGPTPAENLRGSKVDRLQTSK